MRMKKKDCMNVLSNIDNNWSEIYMKVTVIIYKCENQLGILVEQSALGLTDNRNY